MIGRPGPIIVEDIHAVGQVHQDAQWIPELVFVRQWCNPAFSLSLLKMFCTLYGCCVLYVLKRLWLSRVYVSRYSRPYSPLLPDYLICGLSYISHCGEKEKESKCLKTLEEKATVVV